MNNLSPEGTVDKKTDDEHEVKLQKVFKKVQFNLNRLERSVGICKGMFSECCDKLEDLRSQMTELESMMLEKTKNDTQKSPDSSEKLQAKLNYLRKIIYNQNITKDISVSERDQCDNSNNLYKSSENGNQRKKLKPNPEIDEICHSQRANYECVPGPSQERTREENQSHSQEKEIVDKNLDLQLEKTLAEDVIEAALQNTEGVLSATEMKSFLHLSEDVSDPVQLAKLSFTSDIEALYAQLKNFCFLLKAENDLLEKRVPNLNRYLEAKVQSLIVTFQAHVVKSSAESTRDGLFQHFQNTHRRNFPFRR